MKSFSKFVWALVILAGISVSACGFPFDDWKAVRFTASEISDPAIGGENADPDRDGIPNLLEYAFGTDPKIINNATGLPTTTIQGGYYTIQFSQDTSLTDLAYTVEQSTNLTTWNTGSSYVVLQSTVSQGGTRNLLTYRTVTTVASQPKQFLRVRVTNLNGIPDAWALQFLGQIGIVPSTLAPNGSGLTILQCYLQGVDPRQAAPQEPFTVSVAATGPYQAPANVGAVASVTAPASSTITQVVFNVVGTTYSATVTTPPYQCQFSNMKPGGYYVQATAYDQSGKTAKASTDFLVVESNRYNRGWGTDQTFLSTIIAIDYQKGVALDGISDFSLIYPTTAYPWFLRTQEQANELWGHLVTVANGVPLYNHFNAIPKISGTAVGGAPPMVAFGSQGGGTPLYTGQNYNFALAAGGQRAEIPANGDIKIEVYRKAAFTSTTTKVPTIVAAFTYTLPRESDATGWESFVANGYVKDYSIHQQLTGTLSQYLIDFQTQIRYVPSASIQDGWGQVVTYPLLITHKAGNSDFYFKVSYKGTTLPTTGLPTDLAQDSTLLNPVYNVTYSLDFDDRLPWQSTILSQPQFQGAALPSAYQGKSVDELIHNAPVVTDTFTTPASTGLNLSTLNNSPELRSHPVLDKLVASMGSNPMALANYVLNEIELTDALGYNTATGGISDQSINPTGVSRNALAVYLEGQGSPTEQCALLIYLLRQAGYQCGYVFPQHNSTLMFDQQLSKLLHMQIRGANNPSTSGSTYNVPALIPVNYPWVAVYINNQWVHIFPWLKDTAVQEGGDLWSYMPAGYQSAEQWLRKYLLNEPSIRNDATIRSVSTEDNIATIFPLYVQKQLDGKGVSLDQLGTTFYNRRNYYTRWQDFPRPWTTPSVSNTNLAQSLDSTQNPVALNSVLQNIFDTISIQVISDRNRDDSLTAGEPNIDTGTMRLVDLHDRRLMLYHKVVSNSSPIQYNLILVLEPFSSSYSGQYTFANASSSSPDPGTLLNRQMQTVTLSTTTDPSTNDDSILFRVSYTRHRQTTYQATQEHWDAFLGLTETLIPGSTNVQTSYLRKGDMGAFCLNYGRVSQKMMEFQAEKYWSYQQTLTSSSTPVDPEKSLGQLLFVMGQSYYFKTSQFQQSVEQWMKAHSVSTVAYGLSKLSPLRNTIDDEPTVVSNDIDLRYPKVDMFFKLAAWVGNGTTHLDSGDDGFMVLTGAGAMTTVEGSVNEHRVINQFFQQSSAISTVRLLDIAQGWTPATGTASNPGGGLRTLTGTNTNSSSYYATQGNASIIVNKTSGSGTATHALSYWAGWKNTSQAAPEYTIWGQVTKAMTDAHYKDFTEVLMTNGPVTAPGQTGQAYTGVGAFIMSPGSYGALISDNMYIANGGSGPNVGFANYVENLPSSQAIKYFLTPSSDNAYQLFYGERIAGSVYAPNDYSNNNFVTLNDGISLGNVILTPDQLNALNAWNRLASLTGSSNLLATGSSTALANAQMITSGYIGDPVYYGGLFGNPSLTGSGVDFAGVAQGIYDPVNVITGEFYIDSVDLRLNGVMPLEIRRVYGSFNLAENNFGQGWRMNYFPYLMLSTDNATTPTVIYAAEMDGSVIAYRYQTSPTARWVPMAADNPTMANVSNGNIGGTSNPFGNFILQSTVDGATVYTLVGADGSIRTYKLQSYQANGVTQTRPYIQSWKDNRGNSYTFSTGTNSAAVDFGQVNRIQSSNGNYIGFNYDTYGHIVEAYSGDGRRVSYQYDSYGDLVKVTLPDASSIGYLYQHSTTVSGTAVSNYSTHLITQETKPGGRILQNIYDANRRVASQKSTVGTNSSLITNATFDYGTPTKNADGVTYDGRTIVTDVYSRTTTYTYSGNQITAVDSPPQNNGSVRQVVAQTWYTSTASNGYPRSLKTRTDKRGLLTSYQYDTNGNLTNLTVQGNLTGSGSAAETASTTMTYNTSTVTLSGTSISVPLNVIASVTDAVNNGTTYVYKDSVHPYLPTTISKLASGATVSSTTCTYQDIVGSGTAAYGVLQQQTVAANTSEAAKTQYAWNSNGLLTGKTQYTGTGDPNVVTQYTYNLRGELTSQTDAAGRVSRYAYDGRGNRTGEERYDEWGNLVSWSYVYYNQNGEVEWEQGPRFAPCDYTYRQYDGGGRLKQITKQLSGPATDGSGVTPNGYAVTTNTYDFFGNLTQVIEPRHNTITMTYDAIGEMLSRTVHNGTASGTIALTESFTYEAGGQIATHTDALGGMETRLYTTAGQVYENDLPDGTVKTYLYDRIGRVVKETLPNNSYWVTTYNDAQRTVTRELFNSGGTSLASESQSFDRRGNVISKTDRAGYKFTYTYDGLNRLKGTAGPPTVGSTVQQSTVHTYDAAGLKHVVSNIAGERTVSYLDALGRPTLVSVFNRNGSYASNTGYWYSPDHNSVVTTRGSGASAVTTTQYTDIMGHTVLLKNADNSYQLTAYDANGNKIFYSTERGDYTLWTYDTLNNLLTETLPSTGGTDSAVVNYTFNAAGQLLTRQMPGGVTARTFYDTAGRKISEKLDGANSASTRTYTYSYYTTNNSSTGTIKGFLQSVTDPRGFTATTTYDAWMRPVAVNSSGSLIPQQNQSTSYAYDPRGMVSTITQSYAVATSGLGSVVNRGFDAYGQINAETVWVTSATNSTTISKWAQSWDNAGRRSALNFQLSTGTGSQYLYQHNANGLLTTLTNSGTPYTYEYNDAGLLRQRVSPWRTQTVTERDNRGRIYTQNTTSMGYQQFTETMTYRTDSKLDSYDLWVQNSGLWLSSETRYYGYDGRGRLVTEPFWLDNSPNTTYLPNGQQTSYYLFDQTNSFSAGIESGLGVRTSQLVNSSASTVMMSQDNFKRVSQEREFNGTGTEYTFQYGFDAVGNTTTRSVTTILAQTMTWDSMGRLVQVSQRNTGASDFDWTTVYDGLGRRAQTVHQKLKNGVNVGTASTLITYAYDPQVEFLELSLTIGASRYWNVYGPDRSGVYGGLGGSGGQEAQVYESTGYRDVYFNNFFGDAIGQAAVTNGTVTDTYGYYWLTIGGYGQMPGTFLDNMYLQWRGKYTDYTGFISFGARYYDPIGGRWLSPDPRGHAASMSLYDYCNGDPVNGFDPNGRITTKYAQAFDQMFPMTEDPIYQSAYNSTVAAKNVYAQTSASGYDDFTAYAAALAHFSGNQIGGLTPLYEGITGYDYGANRPLTFSEQLDRIEAGTKGLIAMASLKYTAGLNANAVSETPGGIYNPGPNGFVLVGNGTLESATIVRRGEFVNRVYDSGYGTVPQVSGPIGRSFSPGSGVPTTSTQAVVDRGLMIYNANNAQQAIIYQAIDNIPASARTSLGGTAPELLIDPKYFNSLAPKAQYPVVPHAK